MIVTNESKSVWSTEAVRPNHALEYWCQAVGQAMYGVDISSKDKHFYGKLEQSYLGPALVSRLTTGEQKVIWAPGSPADSNVAYFDLFLPLSGSATFAQIYHEGRLDEGDCIILDRRKPFQIANDEMRGVHLAIPCNWLDVWIPDSKTVVGRPIRGSIGWGKVLTTLLAQIAATPPGDRQNLGSVMAEHFAALLSLAVTEQHHIDPIDANDLYSRVMRSLRNMAFDPEFSPEKLAFSLGVSKRYLHHLFAKQSTSFGRELLEVRLEKAYSLLVDTSFSRLSIGDIASRCGFLDQAHFAKRFKERYLQTASAVRR
ncbi:AraC family transcriptional regulator [Pseudomonas sp. NGC7]